MKEFGVVLEISPSGHVSNVSSSCDVCLKVPHGVLRSGLLFSVGDALFLFIVRSLTFSAPSLMFGDLGEELGGNCVVT